MQGIVIQIKVFGLGGVMSEESEMPECRYCGSTVHTSDEFQGCANRHKDLAEDALSSRRKKIVVSPEIGEKRVKDCTVQDLTVFLGLHYPLGFLTVLATSSEPSSGADIALFMTVPPEKAIRMCKYVIAISHQRIRDDNEEVDGDQIK